MRTLLFKFEMILFKAADDAAFRARLLSDREAAIEESGVELRPSEWATMRAVPPAALSAMIDWRVKDGLTKWIAARFSIERVRTAREAYQVIEALKAMIERVLADQYGPTWYNLVFEEPVIQRFINEHRASPYRATPRQATSKDGAIYD